MNTVVLYLTYSTIDYTTYVSVAINDDNKAAYIRMPDELYRVFDVLNGEEISDPDTEWCIVADPEITEWDYSEEFTNQGYPMKRMSRTSHEQICESMANIFGGSYCVCGSAEECPPDKKAVHIIGSAAKPAEPEALKAKPDKQESTDRSDNSKQRTDLAEIVIEKINRK